MKTEVGDKQHESARVSEKAMRQMQDRSARAADPCDLHRAEAQAAPGL